MFCLVDLMSSVIMAIPQVRIHGKGHLLCLSRKLQASLEEENFADVRLLVNKSTSHKSTLNEDDQPQYLRANKAVLAAASPFFASLLKERTEDDETNLVFDGYEYKEIANMLEYIYTGKATITRQEEQTFRYSLDQMQIGTHTKSSHNVSTNLSNTESAVIRKEVSQTILQPGIIQKQVDFPLKTTGPISSKVEKHNSTKHFRRLPVYPSRPLQLPKGEVTLNDPLIDESDFMRNPDVVRPSYLIEKSGSKFNLLTEAHADTAGTLIDYPRMADRLGIYFDPQLFSYYRSLVRSLPPIRIFLHIEEDEIGSDSEDVQPTTMKKSDIVYPSARSGDIIKDRRQRKSFSSSRIPVKTMCCVNGKTHVILDGHPIPIDPTIKAIDYPLVERDQVQSQMEEENSAELEVEAEARRKRVLLSTLSRLKKDHSIAKKVAQNILSASSLKNQDVDSDDGETTESPKKMSSKCSGFFPS